MVIPKPLRVALGLVPGPVEVTRDGAAVRIEPVAGTGTADERGRLVIPDEVALTDDDVRSLRHSDQR